MATLSRALIAVLLLGVAAQVHAQAPAAPRTELYRFVMIQAAPGKLPDLLAMYRQRIPVVTAGGDEAPILIRHSQGDRWDLLVIFPSGSFTDYYSRERVARRETAAKDSGLDGAAYLKQMYDLIAWHEDVFVQGPPIAELRAYLKDMSLAHLEMLQALAGKRDELVKEREMENTFNTLRGRPATLIFTHEQGAAWDVITLDAWRDWRQYGELQMISADVSDAAAKKAGFANADAVGVYMRSLISTHHDTLGPIVKP
ncbi:MAG: hypothetical protein WC815_15645 [Vicinamibacterales bacterium]|jgi:hypothetical protein